MNVRVTGSAAVITSAFILFLNSHFVSTKSVQISVIDKDNYLLKWPSLALDSNGYPHLAYCGASYIKYAKWDGSSWRIQVIESENEGEIDWASLAIDGKDRPHIVYGVRRSGENQYALKYASWSENWKIETIGENLGHWPSIALDSHGVPSVSCCTYVDGGGCLKYLRIENGWKIETVDSEYVVYYNCLKLDSKGFAHISYAARPKENLRASFLKYAFWDGEGWRTQLVDMEDNNVGGQNSVALDRKGFPHISYRNHIKYELKYAAWDGRSWKIDIVDRVLGAYSSIALDENDVPYISYFDGTKVRLAYLGKTGWLVKLIDSGGDYGTSIALDNAGYVYIAYVDNNTTLKLAKYRVPSEVTKPQITLFVWLLYVGACLAAVLGGLIFYRKVAARRSGSPGT